MAEPEEDPFAHTRMTLGEHLEELRSRLLKGLGAILVVFVAAYAFQERVTLVVTRPYAQAMSMLEEYFVEQAEGILAADPERPRTDFFLSADPTDQRLVGFDRRLSAIKAGESFLFVLKVCLYVSIVIGSPVLLWQMWQFIAAGLYPREKRMVTRYFPFSLLAFATGVLFGFFWIVPYGMYFLNRMVSIEVALPTITVQYYLTFLSGLCLVFGLVFQLPLVLTFLGAAGLIDPDRMAHYRGHFAVGAFVVAAMLTPPDPFTQSMMAVPLVVLFEVGLWGARIALRRRRREAAVAPR